jgi:Tfp pilus assembly protein PilO
MKRQVLLLMIVAALLVVILFFLLLFQPKRAELAEVEDRIADQQAQQAQLTGERNRLRQVREDAPGAEADLAAAEAVIPRDPALPSALRQLQLAADESGLILQSVSTSRPVPTDTGTDGLVRIPTNLEVLGSYFQIVDFLRRVEDPAISPRGVRWVSMTITRDEDPILAATMTADLFAVLAAPPPPPAEDAEADEDADVEVDIEVEDDE